MMNETELKEYQQMEALLANRDERIANLTRANDSQARNLDRWLDLKNGGLCEAIYDVVYKEDLNICDEGIKNFVEGLDCDFVSKEKQATIYIDFETSERRAEELMYEFKEFIGNTEGVTWVNADSVSQGHH